MFSMKEIVGNLHKLYNGYKNALVSEEQVVGDCKKKRQKFLMKAGKQNPNSNQGECQKPAGVQIVIL